MANGLVTLASPYGAQETIDRFVSRLATHGMQVFARIDHAAAAAAVGLELRPAEVIIFGNPRSGTPLMRRAPTLAIDLPLRALVWQDDSGAGWLSYNTPDWLAARHGLTSSELPLIAVMTSTLCAIGEAVTRPALAEPPS